MDYNLRAYYISPSGKLIEQVFTQVLSDEKFILLETSLNQEIH